MALGRTNAGGGASLNFKVVGGTTAPGSPTENTIWVNTATAIPSWAFSATEPESPVTGMVWLSTGASSTVAFNALRKNEIRVCPVSAKQYVGGQWTRVEAKTYQDGAWESVAILFYSNGTFDTSYVRTEKKTPGSASIVYGDDAITLSTVGGSTSEVYTVIGPVDLTGLSTLTLSGTFEKASTNTFTNVAALFVAKTATAGYKGAEAIASVIKGAGNTTEAGYAYTAELDVTSLTGSYYIYAGVNTQGSAWASQRINTITVLKGE